LTSAKIQAEQMGLKRVIPLAVSGAFHSPLMASAVEELNQALQDTQFNTPEIPIYFNVLANVQNDAQQFSDLLLKQLTQSVRWRETLQNIPCENFIECGSGKVLSGLVKRTKDAVQIQDTNTLDAIKKILQAEQ
jgi:[acyl-carrier-protein] S-malonyltransferase